MKHMVFLFLLSAATIGAAARRNQSGRRRRELRQRCPRNRLGIGKSWLLGPSKDPAGHA
jgi:hypothetical protein